MYQSVAIYQQMKELRLKGIVGCSLGSFCKANLPEMGVNENAFGDVIEQVCNALEYAHHKGIVKLDVHPVTS
jgi:hypothetical protein